MNYSSVNPISPSKQDNPAPSAPILYDGDGSLPVASVVQVVPIQELTPAETFVDPSKSPYAKLINLDIKGLDEAFWKEVSEARHFSVRQHVKIFPKCGFRCPPCVKKENSYSVFKGTTFDNQHEFLRVDEVSDDWNRCCCNPFHPFRLEMRKYIPVGNDRKTDEGQIADEIFTEIQNALPYRKKELIANLYKNEDPLFTAIRNDGMRCCAFPCKCLSTYVCFEFCQDGTSVFAGSINDEDDLGRNVHSLPLRTKIGEVIQPIYGGCCVPTLDIYDTFDQPKSTSPWATLSGSFIFGGWSEMCFPFQMDLVSSKDKHNLGFLRKKVPDSLGAGVKELFTEADSYTIEFTDPDVTPTQKLTVLSSQLLADYMWFENSEKCEVTDSSIRCNLFNCSIIGKTFTCCITLPKEDKSSGSHHNH